MSSMIEQMKNILPMGIVGSVRKIVGLTASVADFPAPMGAVCRIDRDQQHPVRAVVIGFQGDETLLLPYGELSGVRRGQKVSLIESSPGIHVGDRLLGRVVDGLGQFVDDLPPAVLPHRVPIHAEPIAPLSRPRIEKPLATGIRAIDTLLTCGEGQRLGIFSGSGVGKSTLLGQMARTSSADVNVVVLVGERGREVREFIERDLGPEGLERSVVVVATSDAPALVRLQSAFTGTAIAEYFRDQGKNVLLMMDSVTRFALAQREIGLAAGEPPATRGYPPSVFALLPRLLERSGQSQQGSITGFYTVLVEGDDTNEPIADSVRGILDGHVILSRSIAEKNHWPAIDVLSSISRSMNDVVDLEHQNAAGQVRKLMAAYRQSEDLISIGAYQSGSNPVVDSAITMHDSINELLQQRSHENAQYEDSIAALMQLAEQQRGDSIPEESMPEAGEVVSGEAELAASAQDVS